MSDKTLSDMDWFRFFGGKYLPFVKIASVESCGTVFKAVCSYVCEENNGLPKLDDPLAEALFQSIKQDIDGSFDIYLRKVEGGKKGGRPSKPHLTIPNHRGYIESREEKSREEKEQEKRESKEETEKRESREEAPPPFFGSDFKPPSLDEVKAYCEEAGLVKMDPEKFLDYYAGRGWSTSSGPVSDWKALARNWERREKTDGKEKAFTDYDGGEDFFDGG